MLKQTLPIPPGTSGLALEELPAHIRWEAEKTISDEFEMNQEVPLVWDFKRVRIRRAAEAILEAVEYDETFMDIVHQLKDDIQQNGLQHPVVFGPSGIEGNHRLVALYLLGQFTAYSFVARNARRAEQQRLVSGQGGALTL